MGHAPMFIREMGLSVRLVLYALAGMALMVLDARYDNLGLLRAGLASVVHPLQAQLARPFQFFSEASEFFVIHGELLRANRRLEQSVQQVARAAQTNRDLDAENTRLRALLALPARPGVRPLAVEIVRTLPDPFERRVVIDKGSLNGIVAGRPVVDDLGLIGQVTRVFPASSEVTLLVSREQSAPVLNLRNGLRLMVSGIGSDELLEVRYLDTQADLKPGDILETSGIDGVYPSGIPVARVVRLEPARHTPFARALCAPIAGIGRYRHILVLQSVAAPPPVTAATPASQTASTP
jgi:rod shape-determining protein MreC